MFTLGETVQSPVTSIYLSTACLDFKKTHTHDMQMRISWETQKPYQMIVDYCYINMGIWWLRSTYSKKGRFGYSELPRSMVQLILLVQSMALCFLSLIPRNSLNYFNFTLKRNKRNYLHQQFPWWEPGLSYNRNRHTFFNLTRDSVDSWPQMIPDAC